MITDPNRSLRHRIISGTIATWLGAPAVTAAITAFTTNSLETIALNAAGPFLPMTLVTLCVVLNITDVPTARLPSTMDPKSVRRMMDRIVSIATRGLRSQERFDAQRDIDRGMEQMTALLGKDPWITIEDHVRTDAPVHMLMRAERISGAMMLAEWSQKRLGHDQNEYAELLARCLPSMVAIIRDFGLDPRNLVPGTARLPGQDLSSPVPLPLLAAPVRNLADEWLNGDNTGVPEMERILADGAATRDLRSLEADWARARATSEPEDVDAVDASFRVGVDRISATLSEAIGLRARKDRDQLSTNVRYLDAKHG